jgi:uridine kinase
VLRSELLDFLARKIAGTAPDQRIRVGIDGPDAAGKTTLADELGVAIETLGRPVIRASIDGFHNPASVRYERGKDSAAGYFLDSFDNQTLAKALLEPLGQDGPAHFRRAVFDFRTDRAVDGPLELAPSKAVLLFDGVFLHRQELAKFWEISIFLHVDCETTLRRAELRDLDALGSARTVRERYERRYVPGQRLYNLECLPHQRATFVIENTDLAHPYFVADPVTELRFSADGDVASLDSHC